MRYVITCAVLAVLASVGMVVGAACYGRPSHPASVTHTVTRTLSVPVGYPPYWRMDPPSWCNEDMPCWIGSGADGRSAREALADWHHAITVEP